jgi:hypothetical protein
MSPRFISSLRWFARIVGLLVISIVATIAFGEGYPNPLTLTSTEQLLSMSILIMLAGILLAWKWEGIGGTLLIVGYVTILTTESMHRHSLAVFTFFDYFLLLGILNLGVWWSTKHVRVRA